jgi:hypothetical protein
MCLADRKSDHPHFPVSIIMPPKRIKDTLSDAEKTVLDIAIRLYYGVKYTKEHKGLVPVAWLVQCIEEELVRSPSSYLAQMTDCAL